MYFTADAAKCAPPSTAPWRTVAAAPRQPPLDLSGLAAGAYYCQVREGQYSSSLLLAVE